MLATRVGSNRRAGCDQECPDGAAGLKSVRRIGTPSDVRVPFTELIGFGFRSSSSRSWNNGSLMRFGNLERYVSGDLADHRPPPKGWP